jgi:haloacetate dehalogenase
VPTLDQFERMGAGPSLGYWPWYLLAQTAPFPERLIAAEREHFLRFGFDSWQERPDAVDDVAFGVYLAAFDDTTIAAACADSCDPGATWPHGVSGQPFAYSSAVRESNSNPTTASSPTTHAS